MLLIPTLLVMIQNQHSNLPVLMTRLRNYYFFLNISRWPEPHFHWFFPGVVGLTPASTNYLWTSYHQCWIYWGPHGTAYSMTKKVRYKVTCWTRKWWCHKMETFSVLLVLCAGKSLVNFPHKGQWREAFMCSLICAWINGWVNNRDADDLRCHRAHYDVTVIKKTPHSSPIRVSCLVPVVSTLEKLTLRFWGGFILA